jgi:methyltransferase-like protein
MIPKYTIEYISHHVKAEISHCSTDDPVACEQYLKEMLDRRERIFVIKHEGVDLPKHESDRMIRTAAAMLASERICASLNLKPDEEKYRFGFTA